MPRQNSLFSLLPELPSNAPGTFSLPLIPAEEKAKPFLLAPRGGFATSEPKTILKINLKGFSV